MDVTSKDVEKDASSLTTTRLMGDNKLRAVRITSHGKMKIWVGNSLSFLESLEEDKKLVLHTLPPSLDYSGNAAQQSESRAKIIADKTASSSVTIIPKLVSVVEIIKREFLKHLEATKSTRLIGLHQYNEIGTLEDLGYTVGESSEETNDILSEEAKRSQGIVRALSGKHYPKQIQSPYMRVTLSLKELPEMVERGATYQPPSKRKISKSAKQRAKKRAKKERNSSEDHDEENAEDQPKDNDQQEGIAVGL